MDMISAQGVEIRHLFTQKMFLGGVADGNILTEKSSVVFCGGLENCKNRMVDVHREQTLNDFIKWGLKKVSKI